MYSPWSSTVRTSDCSSSVKVPYLIGLIVSGSGADVASNQTRIGSAAVPTGVPEVPGPFSSPLGIDSWRHPLSPARTAQPSPLQNWRRCIVFVAGVLVAHGKEVRQTETLVSSPSDPRQLSRVGCRSIDASSRRRHRSRWTGFGRMSHAAPSLAARQLTPRTYSGTPDTTTSPSQTAISRSCSTGQPNP